MAPQEQTTKRREERYQLERENIQTFPHHHPEGVEKSLHKLERLYKRMNKEGHVFSWVYKDRYLCRINRNSQGAWCGYVAIPQGHPCYGVHYDNVDVDVHGGLTFSELVHNWGKDMWVLGFDCVHTDDVYLDSLAIRQQVHETYKDKHWVIDETNRLAEQLEEIERQTK